MAGEISLVEDDGRKDCVGGHCSTVKAGVCKAQDELDELATLNVEVQAVRASCQRETRTPLGGDSDARKNWLFCFH